MSSAIHPSSSYTEQRAGKGPSATVPFGRLARVEVRKLVDTRIAIVLLAVAALAAIGAMAVRTFAFDPDLKGAIFISGAVLGVFLPVLGILAVTSEWTKRTVLTTFALEPRRWRVLLAKGVAGVFFAALTSVIMLAAAYALVAGADTMSNESASFGVSVAALIGWTINNVIVMLCGIALGTLMLNAASAIVVFFVGSLVWSVLAFAGEIGKTLAAWTDINQTSIPLVAGTMTGESWAPLAVSVAVWVVLPFVVGAIRVGRSELR
jgi:ABC-type transport system involved in multi-copper enzyme maturation permease subunit